MKSLKRIVVFVLSAVILFTSVITTHASEMDYVIDNEGERLVIPKTYLVKDVITYMGNEGGSLYEPKDIYLSF